MISSEKSTVDSSKLDLVRPQLEKYFESVVFSDTNKYKCLLPIKKEAEYVGNQDGSCDIETDSD